MALSWITSLVVFVAVIALMVFSISRLKIHPFLSILGCALLLALLMGIPLRSIADVLGKGFSNIFASIGLVIILGTLIGLILEKSGAAMRLAESVLRHMGKKHPQLAIMLIGWVLSIPVFCDSGFVIVNPIRKWMSRRSGISSVTMTVALAAGLYVAHVFIPPTPGPVAAAGMVGLGDNLILVILVGAALSVFPLAAGYIFANRVGKKVHSSDETEETDIAEIIEGRNLPSTWLSVLPIILPIVFMGVGSLVSVLKMEGWGADLFFLLGKPVIALASGVICSLPLLRYVKDQETSSKLYGITENTLRTAGPIVFITAAGAMLGQVIYDAGFVELIKANAGIFSALGILFPFLIAAILKTAQGSSTVAMTTTAGMMGMFSSSESLMSAMGMTTPLSAALVVMAIGAGAMTVSHANDSYFWVVTRFGGLDVKDGYRTQTKLTLIMGVVSAAVLYVASLMI